MNQSDKSKSRSSGEAGVVQQIQRNQSAVNSWTESKKAEADRFLARVQHSLNLAGRQGSKAHARSIGDPPTK